MSFVRYIGADTQYQGTSFIRTLVRKDKQIWETKHSSDWTLVDVNENIVASGTCDKINGDLGFYLEIPDTDTETLEGSYLLVAYIYDSTDADLTDIFMEYTLVYNKVVAK